MRDDDNEQSKQAATTGALTTSPAVFPLIRRMTGRRRDSIFIIRLFVEAGNTDGYANRQEVGGRIHALCSH